MGNEERRFGIVVGVADFDSNEQIRPLPYARNDAVRVYETLRDLCGFKPEQLYLLTSSTSESLDANVEAPTRPNILNKLRYVVETATEDDLILVFFASHGAEISNVPYLFTSDSRMNVVKETAIDASEINKELEASSAKCVIRVFDACRSPFGVARSIDGRMTDKFQEVMFASAQGWATISACSSGERSYDEGDFEQGVFSYYFCEGIAGKAANADGNVTLEGLVEYIKTSVSNWSDRQSQKQTPHFQSDVSGLLVLSSPKPIVDETPMVAAEHPLARLQAGIRDELAATASDARQLEFTSKEGIERFVDNVNQCIDRLITDFNDPTITVTTKAPSKNQLVHATHGALNRFNMEMQQLNVQRELTGHPSATEIVFTSSEVVIPSSTLIVASAQFSFFYWLWYMHNCDVPELQKRFAPKPPYHTGFMTFKSHTARDVEKVEAAVCEVLSRSGQAIVEWTQQLGGFVDSRLEPLRNLKSIIE